MMYDQWHEEEAFISARASLPFKTAALRHSRLLAAERSVVSCDPLRSVRALAEIRIVPFTGGLSLCFCMACWVGSVRVSLILSLLFCIYCVHVREVLKMGFHCTSLKW